MAIDLNEKPWWVALLVGLVLGVALFVVLQMYVFKAIEEDKSPRKLMSFEEAKQLSLKKRK